MPVIGSEGVELTCAGWPKKIQAGYFLVIFYEGISRFVRVKTSIINRIFKG